MTAFICNMKIFWFLKFTLLSYSFVIWTASTCPLVVNLSNLFPNAAQPEEGRLFCSSREEFAKLPGIIHKGPPGRFPSFSLDTIPRPSPFPTQLIPPEKPIDCTAFALPLYTPQHAYIAPITS